MTGITLDEVALHNTAQSCWVIVQDHVYDVTDFLPMHPGGAKIILRYAGKDATAAYEPVHPTGTLQKNLPAEKHLGALDPASARAVREAQEESRKWKTQDELRVDKAQRQKPPLHSIFNTRGFEDVARQILSYRAWAYYSSAGDDEITNKENNLAFSRFFFHPRVLRPISRCDPSTTILGFHSRLPIFVSGAALARLGHPRGEASIARGCAQRGIIQMVSYNASLSAEEIADARIRITRGDVGKEKQRQRQREDERKHESKDGELHPTLFWQLYKQCGPTMADRVQEAERLGYKAVFLTVDTPAPGNRERDAHASWVLMDLERTAEGRTAGRDASEAEVARMADAGADGKPQGVAVALWSGQDQDMSWAETIPWLRSVTKLPIVIKGIQCVEDAVLAAEAGVEGILISNHGGRQLDYSMPSIEVLYRLHKQRPDIFSKLEVYMDGGVRRGTDVIKALCMGAKAVGLGRPFLYANSAYGEEGVERLIDVFEEEIIRGMQLLGATNVCELVPEMIERVDWQPIVSRL